MEKQIVGWHSFSCVNIFNVFEYIKIQVKGNFSFLLIEIGKIFRNPHNSKKKSFIFLWFFGDDRI